MASVTIDLDETAWYRAESSASVSALAARPTGGGVHWQNVTRDEMVLSGVAYPPQFPMSDESAVRELFRELLLPLDGALIACDLVDAGLPAIRTIAKYRPAKGYAMAYVGALTVPLRSLAMELSIRAEERTLTGTRETLVTLELVKTAGVAEFEQLRRDVIPIQWKFERYHPGSRGDIAYLVSDDTKYDEEFPDHPLSRVRKALRRIERTFRVAFDSPDDNDLRVTLRQPKMPLMGKDEIISELGEEALVDAMLTESARKAGVDLTLERRQKYADERMATRVQQLVNERQQAGKPDTRQVTSQPWSGQEVADVVNALNENAGGQSPPERAASPERTTILQRLWSSTFGKRPQVTRLFE